MSLILGYFLLALGILLLILLLAPLHYECAGEYGESIQYQARIRWAGGVLAFVVAGHGGQVKISFRILGKKVSPSTKGDKPPKAKTQSASESRKDSRSHIGDFMSIQLWSTIWTGIRRLWQALHLALQVSGRYGFEDPSLTGFALASMSALNCNGNSFDLRADFTEEVLDVRGSLRGWLVPLQILLIGLIIIFKKPVRALWWPKIKMRKRQKEAVQYA